MKLYIYNVLLFPLCHFLSLFYILLGVISRLLDTCSDKLQCYYQRLGLRCMKGILYFKYSCRSVHLFQKLDNEKLFLQVFGLLKLQKMSKTLIEIKKVLILTLIN